jgi:GGDEF domain-containing protein
VIARWGGDEIVILCRAQTFEMAEKVIEPLKQFFENSLTDCA